MRTRPPHDAGGGDTVVEKRYPLLRRGAASCAAVLCAATSSADLIGVEPGFPLTLYNNQGVTTYSAAEDLFAIDANPIAVQLAPDGIPRLILPVNGDETVQIQAIVDENGGLVGGVDGDDFVVIGQVDLDGDGEIDAEGVLITGEVTEFGFFNTSKGGLSKLPPALARELGPRGRFDALAAAGLVDQYDFRITVTGGELASLYDGFDIGLTVTSEMSTFNGVFTKDFEGEAKGTYGPIERRPGACCLFDGTCIEVTEDECVAQGGDYQGDGVGCDDVDCPARGACCLFDGTCIEVTEDACAMQGGDFQGVGVQCAEVDCPARGACCLFDGTCIEVTEDECAMQGGDFQGVGVGCDEVDCPARGACCLFDGTCIEVTEDACAMQGGDFQGVGTRCADVDCPGNGACCLFDGTCIETTMDDCVAQGGDFQGVGTTCADVMCVPLGACCLEDGSCVEVSAMVCATLGGDFQGDGVPCADVVCEPMLGACCLPDGTCIIATPSECDAEGGDYQGDDTQCTPEVLGEPGVYRLRNHPDGNQAAPFYGLRLDELFDVTSGNDVFTFDFETPESDMRLIYDGVSIRIVGTAFGGRDIGAGYDPDYTSLIEVDFTYDLVGTADPDDDLIVTTPSMTNSGTVTWLATGETFVLSDKANDEGFTFRFGDEDDDMGHRGFPGLSGWGWLKFDHPVDSGARDFIFTAESICTPPPPTGACCLPGGMCVQTTADSCAAQGGQYFGDGVECADVTCGPPPVGACCLCTGGCIEVTLVECLAMDGVFLGVGESCAGSEVVTIDFSVEDDGVTPLVNGQPIEADDEFGLLLTIDGDGGLGAAIFDTTPGVNAADVDLQVGLGNALILQDNDDSADDMENGLWVKPDDFEGGGVITVDYLQPVEPLALTLIDICQGPQSVEITLIDIGGQTRTYFVEDGWTYGEGADGPPGEGWETVDLTTLDLQIGEDGGDAIASEDAGYNPTAVVRMTVDFEGSGAMDNLVFGLPVCPPPTCLPGACCLPDGTCLQLTEDECLAEGGEFNGVGVDCNDVETFTYFGAPPEGGRNEVVGQFVSLETSFNPNTKRFTWEAVFAPNNGDLPTGFTTVVNDGPNPKNHPGELAIFYYDFNDLGNPILTVYGYNGQSGSTGINSFEDGDGDGDAGDGDRIVSSLVDPSWINSLTATLNNDGTLTVGFDIDASPICNHPPAFPDPDTDWFGVGFDEFVGYWFHPIKHGNVSYANGDLAEWSGQSGYLDSNFVETTSLACVPTFAALIGHWNFDTQTGDVVPDVIGGVDLQIQEGNGDIVWINDGFGAGVQFNQSPSSGTARIQTTSDSAAAPIREAIQARNAFTVMAYMRQTGGSTSGARVVSYSTSTSMDDRNFSLIGDPSDAGFDNWTRVVTSEDTFSDGPDDAWGAGQACVAAFSYDPVQGVKVYVDGDLVHHAANVGGDLSNWVNRRLLLGNEDTNDRPFVGAIYDVRIWAGALSDDEVLLTSLSLLAGDAE